MPGSRADQISRRSDHPEAPGWNTGASLGTREENAGSGRALRAGRRDPRRPRRPLAAARHAAGDGPGGCSTSSGTTWGGRTPGRRGRPRSPARCPGPALAWLDGATGDHVDRAAGRRGPRRDRWAARRRGPRRAGDAAAGGGRRRPPRAVEVTGPVPADPVAGSRPGRSSTASRRRSSPAPGRWSPWSAPPTSTPSWTVRPTTCASRTGTATPTTTTAPSGATPPAPARGRPGRRPPRAAHLRHGAGRAVPAGPPHRPAGPGVPRLWGSPVPAQEPQRVLRPPLGVLRLPDGGLVPLDRPW